MNRLLQRKPSLTARLPQIVPNQSQEARSPKVVCQAEVAESFPTLGAKGLVERPVCFDLMSMKPRSGKKLSDAQNGKVAEHKANTLRRRTGAAARRAASCGPETPTLGTTVYDMNESTTYSDTAERPCMNISPVEGCGSFNCSQSSLWQEPGNY